MAVNETDMRILVIDDNPEIHNDFLKILKTSPTGDELDKLSESIFGESSSDTASQIRFPSFQIDTASQGLEGVDKIRLALEKDHPYALAFVDVRMPPGLDGVETIQEIWKLDPDIQTVICTAYSDYTWEETISKLGVSDNLLIIKKPFDSVSVRQLACALTKKWMLTHQTRIHTATLEERVKERTNSLQHALSLTRATLESSADGILVVDNNGAVVDFNKKYMSMWSVPDSVQNSKRFDDIFEHQQSFTQDAEIFKAKIFEIKSKENGTSIEIFKLKNGKAFELYTQPHQLNNDIIGRVWSYRDITERLFLEEKLAYQANHDSLTGLPNRELLNDRLEQAMAEGKRYNNIVGVIFFDLDRFKLINDSLSHEVGDELLQQVANRLKASIRDVDTVARLGGDEFVMVLPRVSREDDLMRIANKIVTALREPFMIGKRELVITSSAGISHYPKDGATISELLRNADLAMYRSKDAGGNQFQFYTESLNTRTAQFFEMSFALRHALNNHELFLVYQPQIESSSSSIIAVEALLRWQHPQKGLILPLDFIPIAEQSGMLIELEEWSLKEACRQNKKWQDQGFKPIRVSVNVTSDLINQPNFVEIIAKTLNETGLKGQWLEIELTENLVIHNEGVVKAVQELKKLGVNIALDDFGAGNSCLNMLRNIPIDRLKIDKTFIDNITTNKNGELIVSAIIAMAKSLNLDVVAEGVESQKQIDFLNEQKCREYQGYYYSKPVIADALEKMLKRG